MHFFIYKQSQVLSYYQNEEPSRKRVNIKEIERAYGARAIFAKVGQNKIVCTEVPTVIRN